jgi:hypothetical protein
MEVKDFGFRSLSEPPERLSLYFPHRTLCRDIGWVFIKNEREKRSWAELIF